jgi:hypothetical protein
VSILWREQVSALIGLRMRLWWRRIVHGRQWARLLIGALAAIVAASFSASLCLLALQTGRELRRRPELLAMRGGPLSLFAAWVSMVLAGRIWFGLVALAQSEAFLDPRRFRTFPVSARLLSAINFAALLLDPVWLVLYPPLVATALAVAAMPRAPAAWALLIAEAFAVWATASLLHLGAALAALFDSRPSLRRLFSVALLLAGFAGFQLSVALPGRRGLESLFAPGRWWALSWTPPGWMATLADALSHGPASSALWSALLLFLLGAACSAGAHALSRRELLRPPEPVRARPGAARGAGWRLPLAPASISALFEKEAKTVIRLGWLQLLVVPVAYLLLVHAVLPGPQPLLIAAVYAHLGVLEIATNAFGRDRDAARAWFLWPVTMRSVLAAKNAVAWLFSLAIFLLLALVAALGTQVTGAQVLVGVLAHTAVFPLLATFGNVVSVLFPVPVHGARLRRIRGAGPVGARFAAMFLLAGAAWAPYAIARALAMPVPAAYAGELLALLLAYPALLGLASRLAETRREALLGSLARDE